MSITDSQECRLAARLRAISRVALLVMLPLVFYFTSRGTWDPREQNLEPAWSAGFFASQATSILHGRLDVAPADIVGECFDRDGRCYGYFGVTPSLVRLPLLGILRYVRSALTPIFLGFAVLAAYWAALEMLQRSLRASPGAGQSPRLALGYCGLCAAALGPGGSLIFVTRPAVYEEAIAWGVAFVLLAFNHVWAWHSGERRSLVPAVFYGIAAANARPTAAVACAVLGATVVAGWYRARRRRAADPTFAIARPGTRAVLVAGLCLSLAPGLTAAGVFWLKLRSPMPSPLLNQQVAQEPHWQAIRQRNGGRTAGLVFAPTELVAYFRPDAVVRRRDWPWFDFRFPDVPILWVPPLAEGGAYVERVSSLTATMPLPWMINLLVAGWLARRAFKLARGMGGGPSSTTADQWLLEAGLLASAGAMPLLILTTHGITNRYLADFFAISAVGAALGPPVVLPWLARRPILAAAAGVVAFLLVFWSVVVTVSLNTRLVF